MKNLLWFCLFGSLWLVGCASNNEPAPNENVDALHQQFHGRYEIVSSISSEPVDVNLDGRSSVDLLQEYPYLKEHFLQITIQGPDKYTPKRVFLFTQFWPEQYLSLKSVGEWTGQVVAYEPNSMVNFAMQTASRTFTFSSDLKEIQVIPTQDKTENSFRWQRPELVMVDVSDYVTTINKRRLYTTSGVKDVVITTLYRRYTTVT